MVTRHVGTYHYRQNFTMNNLGFKLWNNSPNMGMQVVVVVTLSLVLQSEQKLAQKAKNNIINKDSALRKDYIL